MIKIKIKIILVKIHIKILENFKVKIIGRIRAISTSKIKKIIAIKKNRIEKGSREEFNGLNPHSKGESFSRSCFFFRARRVDRIITIIEMAIITIAIRDRFKIIYIKIFKPCNWKLHILIILYKFIYIEGFNLLISK